MTNQTWPKEWLDVLGDALTTIHTPGRIVRCEDVLDQLHNIGALRDPPRKRELLECRVCGSIKRNPPVPAPDNPYCGKDAHEYRKYVESDE